MVGDYKGRDSNDCILTMISQYFTLDGNDIMANNQNLFADYMDFHFRGTPLLRSISQYPVKLFPEARAYLFLCNPSVLQINEADFCKWGF